MGSEICVYIAVSSNVISIRFLLTVDDSWDASVLVNSSTPCQDFSVTPTAQKLADHFPWPPVSVWVIQALAVNTKTLHAITPLSPSRSLIQLI